MCLLLLPVLGFDGLAATRIPIGAPIVVSPLETLASSYAWSCEDDARGVDRDGEVVGRL